MVFKKITSIQSVVAYLANEIKIHLRSNQKVLWLISGVSYIDLAVEVSKLLIGEPLDLLSMTLTDERYGAPGHDNSNWQQLAAKGFTLKDAVTIPVLTGEDMRTTTEEFDANLESLLNDSDYSIGSLGIGPDGHTAGILPGSPAVGATGFATSYTGHDFERITMTPQALGKLDEVVVYAVGEPKWPVLDLLETDIPATDQPAQLLKVVPKLTIFNDYKGEDV